MATAEKKTRTINVVTQPFVRIDQHGKTFLLLKLHAADLVAISYVASRGDSDEQGAVQRLLNRARISAIRDYTLRGGTYPSAIILNWVNTRNEVILDRHDAKIPIVDRSAQIIDGQHRVAGLRAAIDEKPAVGKLEIPVALFQHLGTQQCADIFLSINTEQKPVPKSLVYDLYGLASEYIVDFAAARAKDIATSLNEVDDSPYFGMIKFPGRGKKKGGIALSTAVAAVKPLVATKGTLEQHGIESLEQQTQVILNFFMALQNVYGGNWDNKDNAFMYAAGFMGAMEFFRTRLFEYCVRKRSFEVATMRKALTLGDGDLIRQSDLRGLGGAKARETVLERLMEAFTPEDGQVHKSFKF